MMRWCVQQVLTVQWDQTIRFPVQLGATRINEAMILARFVPRVIFVNLELQNLSIALQVTIAQLVHQSRLIIHVPMALTVMCQIFCQSPAVMNVPAVAIVSIPVLCICQAFVVLVTFVDMELRVLPRMKVIKFI
jgi:hypothetical protein